MDRGREFARQQRESKALYKKLRARIENEYHAKLHALDVLLKPFGDVTEAARKVSSGDVASGVETPQPYGSLAETVKQVVKEQSGEFTLVDVIPRVLEKRPESSEASIAGALVRLVNKPNGEVIVVRPREGKKGAVYKLKV